MIPRLVSVPDMSRSVKLVLQVVMCWTHDRNCLIAPRNLDLDHRLSLSSLTPVYPQSCKHNPELQISAEPVYALVKSSLAELDMLGSLAFLRAQ